jgi:hypothetical protein
MLEAATSFPSPDDASAMIGTAAASTSPLISPVRERK